MINDFLVLGQIPGTNILITFNEVLFAIALYLVAHIVYKISSIQVLHRKPLTLRTKKGQQLSLL